MGNAESTPAPATRAVGGVASPKSKKYTTIATSPRRQRVKIDSGATSSEEEPGSSSDWDHDDSNENIMPNRHRRGNFQGYKPVQSPSKSPRPKEAISSPRKGASSVNNSVVVSSPRKHRQKPREPEERKNYTALANEVRQRRHEQQLRQRQENKKRLNEPTSNDESEEYDDIEEDTALSVLMEASAAVFHYLTATESKMGNEEDSGYTFSDDTSLAERSAAVFEYLQQEASEGNEVPTKEFMGTAQAVSDIILRDQYGKQPPPGRYAQISPRYEDAEGEFSMSRQRAAIFQALDRSHQEHTLRRQEITKNGVPQQAEVPELQDEDELPQRDRPPSRLEVRSDVDADSVISEISLGIFKVLDQAKERVADEESLVEFSTAIFDVLRKDEQSEARDDHDDAVSDALSLSERSADIFKFLNQDQSPVAIQRRGASPEPRKGPHSSAPKSFHVLPRKFIKSSQRSNDRSSSTVSSLAETLTSHLKPRTDPKKLMQKNIFHILAQRNRVSTVPPIPEMDHEEEEDNEETLHDEECEYDEMDIPTPKEEEEDNEETLHDEECEDDEMDIPTPKAKTREHTVPLETSKPATSTSMKPNSGHFMQPSLAEKKREQQQLHLLREPKDCVDPLREALEKTSNSSKLQEPKDCMDPLREALEKTSTPSEPQPNPDVIINEDPEVINVEELASERASHAIVAPVFSAPAGNQFEVENLWAQEEDDDIDMEFVERFDQLFDEFIGQNPNFTRVDPNLVHHLRINKLHKMLEHMDNYEMDLLGQLEERRKEKEIMESTLSEELRQASRDKASNQVRLQAELSAFAQRLQMRKAKMIWKIVNDSEIRVKKDYLLEQTMKKKQSEYAHRNVSGIPSREEVLELMPTDEEGRKLNLAASAKPRHLAPKAEQVDELRKYQVDNAFMTSQVSLLQQKLATMEEQSKRLGWVDSVLLRMDRTKMVKLRNKFTSKLGFQSLE